MATPLILIVTLIYFTVGIIDVYNNQVGMGICFFSYGVANIGLILAQRGM